MASSFAGSAPMLTAEPKVDQVQIDSLVVMKIVKHVDTDFYSVYGMSEGTVETCQGILTGLVSVEDRCLEITNCFPTPRTELNEGEGANPATNMSQAEERQVEIQDMLKRFRLMNIDYELVGFYQAHLCGAFHTQDMFDSLVDYQICMNDGVILVYDPVKTRNGQFTMRAYRLSKRALELSLGGDWAPEVLKKSGLSFSSIFEELPVRVRNSKLTNVMLAELSLPRQSKHRAAPHLEIGNRRNLEKSLRSMAASVDDLNKSVAAFNKYTLDKGKYDAIFNSLIQKRIAENEQRLARGEPALPLDDIKKQFKQPQLQCKNGMLDLVLSSRNIEALASYLLDSAGDNVSKLFVSEEIAGSGEKGKERATSTSRS